MELVKLDVHSLSELDSNANVSKTDDSAKYGRENIKATIQAIYSSSGFVDSIDDSSVQYGVLLDKTPFYAEQGLSLIHI